MSGRHLVSIYLFLCGFLLPPAQTLAAARVAARNIRRYADALGYPTAFETGVNSLALAGQQNAHFRRQRLWIERDVVESSHVYLLRGLRRLVTA